MSSRVLVLHQGGSGANLLRSVVLNEGGGLEEAPIHSSTAIAALESYRVLLLDVGRPNHRLLEILMVWRDQAPGVTIIVVGSRTSRTNRLAVLESGASAYLIKPVVAEELAARVRAAFRHAQLQRPRPVRLSSAGKIIDFEARVIRSTAGPVRLTPTECSILEKLALHANQTVPRGDLVKSLWGSDPQKGVRSLRLFIRNLRQKLEPDPTHPIYLVTDLQIGYRLQLTGENPIDRLPGSDLP